MNTCKRSNIQLTQKTGQSMKEIMSLKAVTDELNKESLKREEATNSLSEELKKTLTDIQEVQLAVSNEAYDREIGDLMNMKLLQGEEEERIKEDNRVESYVREVEAKFEDYPKLEDNIIPSRYLPSYVDDVVEFDKEVTGSNWYNQMSMGQTVWVDASEEDAGEYYHKFITKAGAAFGQVIVRDPEAGKIYVNLSNNLTYRWSGSNLIEISKSIALGETSSTAYPGDKGKEIADRLDDYIKEINLIDPTYGTLLKTFNSRGEGKLYISALKDGQFEFEGGNNNLGFRLADGYTRGKANGIATLDADGKVPSSQLPDKVSSSKLIVHNLDSIDRGFELSQEDQQLVLDNAEKILSGEIDLYIKEPDLGSLSIAPLKVIHFSYEKEAWMSIILNMTFQPLKCTAHAAGYRNGQPNYLGGIDL